MRFDKAARSLCPLQLALRLPGRTGSTRIKDIAGVEGVRR